MQINAKALQDAAWKDVVAKNKSIKDNGLLKVLSELKKVDDEQHETATKLLDEVLKLATQLKKDKAVAALAPVVKHLSEMISAAESTRRDVAKARAEQEKSNKAKAEAEKKAAAKKEAAEDDEDDEDDEPSEMLTTKLKPLLKLVAKGDRMHALVAKSGKKVVVMLSRKPISPARRKVLTEQLGGGSTKFYPGHCSLEAGTTTFVLKAEVAGLSKLIKLALLEQTGLRINKIKCRGEDGDDDDGDEDAAAQDPEEGDDDDDGGDDAAAAAEAERARRKRGSALDDIESELRLLRRSFR